MADERTELDSKDAREKRTEAFRNNLGDELDKLLREPEHTEWLEDVITNNPCGYDTDISYAAYIEKYIERFYDKYLKDKYGDRGNYPYDDAPETGEFDFSRESRISDVIGDLGHDVSMCAKTKINWDSLK